MEKGLRRPYGEVGALRDPGYQTLLPRDLGRLRRD